MTKVQRFDRLGKQDSKAHYKCKVLIFYSHEFKCVPGTHGPLSNNENIIILMSKFGECCEDFAAVTETSINLLTFVLQWTWI